MKRFNKFVRERNIIICSLFMAVLLCMIPGCAKTSAVLGPTVSRKCAVPYVQATTARESKVRRSSNVHADEKLVLSPIMNCYPLNGNMYSDRVNLETRPLDWNPRLSGLAANVKKLRLMEKAGVDVALKLIYYGNGNNGILSLGQTLQAAKKTDLLVAPEVICKPFPKSGLHGLTKFLRRMILRYGNNPRWLRYDGRLVFFFYAPLYDGSWPEKKVGLAQFKKLWRGLGSLRKKMYAIDESFYLVSKRPAQRYWSNAYIDRVLSVFDNMDYVMTWPNGAQERRRLELMAGSLIGQHIRPRIAAVIKGYFRKNTGILNPFRASRMFREQWSAAMSVQPDWIYASTWDDYSENTGFEPTRFDRGFYSALLRAKAAEWQKLSAPSPELWLGTPLVDYHGAAIYSEVVNLDNPLKYHKMVMILRNSDGIEVWKSKPVEERGSGAVRVFPVTIPTYSKAFRVASVLVPTIRLYGVGASVRTFNGLPPIRLMPNNPIDPLYRFTRLDQICRPAKVQWETTPCGDGRDAVTGRFLVANTASQIRRIELRNFNDDPMPFSLNGAKISGATLYLPLLHPVSSISGTYRLDASEVHDPMDERYLFVEFANGDTWSSKPFVRRLVGKKRMLWTEFHFQKTKSYNGFWVAHWPDIWKPIAKRSIAKRNALIADWDFNRLSAGATEVKGRDGYDSTLYLGMGTNHREYVGNASDIPDIRRGKKGAFLHFNGGSQVARLPTALFPVGSFTLEMRIRPVKTNAPMALFYYKCGPISLTILPGGYVKLDRAGAQAITKSPIQFGRWSVLRVGDDGSHLFIDIDGKNCAMSKHSPLHFNFGLAAYCDLGLFGGLIGTRSPYNPFHVRTLLHRNAYVGDISQIKIWAGFHSND